MCTRDTKCDEFSGTLDVLLYHSNATSHLSFLLRAEQSKAVAEKYAANIFNFVRHSVKLHRA